MFTTRGNKIRVISAREMNKKERKIYEQAEKDTDLEIFQSFNIKDIEIFNRLHLEVVKTQKFVPFSLEYFKKEFSNFLEIIKLLYFLPNIHPHTKRRKIV